MINLAKIFSVKKVIVLDTFFEEPYNIDVFKLTQCEASALYEITCLCACNKIVQFLRKNSSRLYFDYEHELSFRRCKSKSKIIV